MSKGETMETLKKYFSVTENRTGVWVGGEEIAYLSDRSGVTQVWKMNIRDRVPHQVTHYSERIWNLGTAANHRDLLFTTDLGGNEQEQIFLLRSGEEEARDLCRDGSVRFCLGGTNAECDTLYFTCNRRSRAHFDVCKMDIATGAITTVLENNDNLNMPAAVSPDGKYFLINKLKGMSDNRMWIVNMETGEAKDIFPAGAFAQYGSPAWKSDSSGFYFTTDEDSEFLFAGYYDVATATVTEIYRTNHDVTRLALSSDDKYLALVVSIDGYGEFRILDLASGRFLATPMPPKGFLYVYAGMQWSPAGHKLLFTFSSGSRPSGLWVLDLDNDACYALTDSGMDESIRHKLAEPELRHFRSFDGLEISYWFYRAGNDPHAPTVLQIHGGPESQEFPMYDPLVQYLVGQGFNIAAPNIRGSIGYGKSFHHLDDVEKRLDSIHDIACLAEHLLAEGLAEAGRLGIMGASYGGYATLASIANYPALWSAAVDIVGMSDLETFLENTAPYRRAHREGEYGSLEKHRDVLRRVSPIHKAGSITAPLMVIHGANDPRVPVGQAEQIVSNLESRGIAVEYLCYGDEGHGIMKLTNKLHCYPRVAAFLKKHLM